MLLAFMTPIFGWMLFIQGFTFWRTETNTLLDYSASTVTALVYSAAIASLGIFIAVMMGKCRLVAQFVVCSSLTLLFISGDLFAYQNIPTWARWLSQISPSTPGIHAMVRASQAGASVSQIYPYILHLVLLTLVFILLTYVRTKSMRLLIVDRGTMMPS
jgi:ABC-type polysaccharide/polyol phosphate export permease